MSERARPPIPLVVGVTGHRDLVPGEVAMLRSRLEEFFDHLAGTFPDLPPKALTSLAEGADRLFAEVALERGIPLVAVLPMTRDEYEQDFVSTDSRDEFRALLARAEVIELGPPPTESLFPPAEGPDRDRCYAEAGMFIAAHCQVLVALWDGLPSDKRGGTADVVSFRITGRMPGVHAVLSGRVSAADVSWT